MALPPISRFLHLAQQAIIVFSAFHPNQVVNDGLLPLVESDVGVVNSRDVPAVVIKPILCGEVHWYAEATCFSFNFKDKFDVVHSHFLFWREFTS